MWRYQWLVNLEINQIKNSTDKKESIKENIKGVIFFYFLILIIIIIPFFNFYFFHKLKAQVWIYFMISIKVSFSFKVNTKLLFNNKHMMLYE